MSTRSEGEDTSTKESSDAAKIDRTIGLLDSEIELIRSAQTQHGWTSWGLVAGIVGSLWLLSDELKSGSVHLETTALAILLFSTLVDSVRWLIYQLWQWKDPRNDPARLRWSNEFFSGSELVFLIEILRSIGLLIVAFLFAPRSWVSLLSLTIAYVWYSIMAMLWLVMTQTEFPIKQGFTRKGFAFVLAFVLPCFASFFLYLRFAPVPISEVIASYRAGGLFVAICYLILSLGLVTRDSPILHSLIGVRRNLVFNRVEISSAASQAEIALNGMEVPDAIRKDLPPILALVERLNEDTNRLELQVSTMQAHLPTKEDREDTISAKIKLLTAHRNNAEALLNNRASTLQLLNSKFQQLMKRRQRIQGIMPETANFFEQLDSGMRTILEESDSRFNQYVENANKYDEQLAKAKGISAIKEE